MNLEDLEILCSHSFEPTYIQNVVDWYNKQTNKLNINFHSIVLPEQLMEKFASIEQKFIIISTKACHQWP
jgi:hypothetical protein